MMKIVLAMCLVAMLVVNIQAKPAKRSANMLLKLGERIGVLKDEIKLVEHAAKLMADELDVNDFKCSDYEDDRSRKAVCVTQNMHNLCPELCDGIEATQNDVHVKASDDDHKDHKQHAPHTHTNDVQSNVFDCSPYDNEQRRKAVCITENMHTLCPEMCEGIEATMNDKSDVQSNVFDCSPYDNEQSRKAVCITENMHTLCPEMCEGIEATMNDKSVKETTVKANDDHKDHKDHHKHNEHHEHTHDVETDTKAVEEAHKNMKRDKQSLKREINQMIAKFME